MEEKKLLVRNNLPYNEVYVLNIYASFVPKCSICLAAGDCIDIFIFGTRPVYSAQGNMQSNYPPQNKENTKKGSNKFNSSFDWKEKKKKEKKKRNWIFASS